MIDLFLLGLKLLSCLFGFEVKTIEMGTKVKGLLKGLRYISHIFDGEKEQEIQIGFPTDVKHVAHIGWDDPSVNINPTWMKEFHSAPLSASFAQDARELVTSPKSLSQEIPLGGIPPSPDSPSSKPHRRSRRHVSSLEPNGSESESTRRSRRHQSLASASGSESGEGSRRGSRRSSKSSAAGSESAPGPEPSARDPPLIPKQSRRRKTKLGSDGGSTRSSTRSKDPSISVPDPGMEESSTRPVAVERVSDPVICGV